MVPIGYGSWSASSYKATTGAKISSGSTFGYSATAKASGRYEAHKSLDPKVKNSEGKLIRESRDSVDNPNSVPIAIFFDETGSMGSVPRVAQEKLSGLFNLLIRKAYVEDPQILVGAYGDAKTDYVPLQVSQFESDNKTDDNLDNIFIEGNGGGNFAESAALAWYYVANHTVTDAWEKRGKKGYFFFIADERTHDLTAGEVKEFIGSDEPVGDLTAKGIANKLKEKWEVYCLLIDNASAKMQDSATQYAEFFGKDHVLVVENPETISETIGAALGRLENEDLDEDDLVADLIESGASKAVAANAAKAVVKLGAGGKGALAKGDANLKLDAEDDGPIVF